MDETKQHALAYLHQSLTTTTVDSAPQEQSTAQSSLMEPAGLPPGRWLRTRLSRWLQLASNLRYISSAELTAFLKRTRRLWLTAAGVVFGLIVLVTPMHRLVQWAINARERRHQLAVATVTPDRLIARCGGAAHDVTKQVFPIVMRTISYQAGDRTVVLTFSRTAEDKSDWVFLSMNDENGSASYETPDTKIAALPCLDSTK
jgi:hypothetical protein